MTTFLPYLALLVILLVSTSIRDLLERICWSSVTDNTILDNSLLHGVWAGHELDIHNYRENNKPRKKMESINGRRSATTSGRRWMPFGKVSLERNGLSTV